MKRHVRTENESTKKAISEKKGKKKHILNFVTLINGASGYRPPCRTLAMLLVFNNLFPS